MRAHRNLTEAAEFLPRLREGIRVFTLGPEGVNRRALKKPSDLLRNVLRQFELPPNREISRKCGEPRT